MPTTTVNVRRNLGNTRVSINSDVVLVKVRIEAVTHPSYTHIIHVKNTLNQVIEMYIRNRMLVFHTGAPEMDDFPWQSWLTNYETHL